MVLHRTTLRFTASVVAAAFGAAVLAAPLREARADEVSPTGKGITGGALLGAEVVTIVESLFGVRSGWAYAIGAVVGAGGGGVGGYFVEHSNTDGKVPTYMLAGGLALVIPALVLTLNATRYMPEEGATEDKPPVEPAPPPTPTTPQPTTQRMPGAQTAPSRLGASVPANGSSTASEKRPAKHSGSPALSLVDVQGGAFRLGVPAVEVRRVFTVAEERQYGMKNDTELRMPVVHVSF